MFDYSGSEESLASELMMNFSLEVLALTKGGEGSVLYMKDNVSEMKTDKINIADTVGAGDAFAAGLAYGLLYQLSIDETHSIANNIASYVCSKHGATPTIESKDLKRILNIEREMK
jgi:fructokinase